MMSPLNNQEFSIEGIISFDNSTDSIKNMLSSSSLNTDMKLAESIGETHKRKPGQKEKKIRKKQKKPVAVTSATLYQHQSKLILFVPEQDGKLLDIYDKKNHEKRRWLAETFRTMINRKAKIAARSGPFIFIEDPERYKNLDFSNSISTYPEYTNMESVPPLPADLMTAFSYHNIGSLIGATGKPVTNPSQMHETKTSTFQSAASPLINLNFLSQSQETKQNSSSTELQQGEIRDQLSVLQPHF